MTKAAPIPEDAIVAICDGLAEGVPLSVTLRTSPGMPKWDTVMVWQRNNPELAARIRDARQFGWDTIAHRCRAVARGDTEHGSSGHVPRDKLIIYTDLQLLAKWDYKRYGDKIEHTGNITHTATDLPTMTEQLVTQVTLNPTLLPVLKTWAADLLAKLEAT